MNICLMSDSYKYTHANQYPAGTQYVYSYLESRGGLYNEVEFFGLQYILKKYLEGVRVTKEMVDEAKEIIDQHLGPGIFNYNGWMYIVEKHGGKLPLKIMSVPEGTRVGVSNVLVTVVNTDPLCWWLTNFVETILMKVWYPTTVATLSRKIKELILEYLEKTGDPGLISSRLHDFGYRGAASEESARLGGSAHLVNFTGTDTVGALMLLKKYYRADMAGFSIPAMEHSTVTSWRVEDDSHEVDAYENMLDTFPNGFVSIVCDSYDTENACANIFGGVLKQKIERRNGTVVVRPDSGIPSEIVLMVLNILGEKFGYSYNDKGYKVLPAFIRVIQGDGVNFHSIREILRKMEAEQWSADNIVFGMGGALLQQVNRDTQMFAFKCSSICVNGEWFDVYKKPKTDPRKDSKRGQLSLFWGGGKFQTVRKDPYANIDVWGDRLVTTFLNGTMVQEYHLEEIRGKSNTVNYGTGMSVSSIKEI